MSLNFFLPIVKWFQVLLYKVHISYLFAHIVCSIWPIDKTLSGATISGQGGPASNVNEGVLHIPQIYKAGALLFDGLMSYPGHILVGVLPLCSDVVGVFYYWLSNSLFWSFVSIQLYYMYV